MFNSESLSAPAGFVHFSTSGFASGGYVRDEYSFVTSTRHSGYLSHGVTPSNLRYSSETSTLLFTTYVYEDGDVTTVKKQDAAWENRGNSVYVYDATFVRHWDAWRGPKRPSIFTVALIKNGDDSWTLGSDYAAPLRNTGHYVLGGDDFNFRASHIVYTVKDPDLPPAMHTRQNVYIVDLTSPGQPRELTSGKQGLTHNPIFNKAGDKVAWLERDLDGYDADRTTIVIYDLKKGVRFTIAQSWDRSPNAVVFSADGSTLYFAASDEARVKIFALPVPETPEESFTHPTFPPDLTTPVALTTKHSASGLQALPNDRLLYTRSSFTSLNDLFVIHDLKNSGVPLKVDQITNISAKELAEKDLEEPDDVRFEGANGRKVQQWVFKPKGFRKGAEKSFPVVLMIYGGPQAALEDTWSSRWNMSVFAHQGYFVIAPNYTGSTSFGQDFTDDITEDWGGKPFIDLQKGWKYALEKYPEIDPDRAVAAGGSWGGYAMNWIQGHPEFGFGFKALVNFQGIFNTEFFSFSTDELFFTIHDFGGKPYEEHAKETLRKNNPADYVQNWSIPMLVIHSSKDYRVPETEGIAAFHALQMRNIPSRFVLFPEEDHWNLSPGNNLKWHYEILQWFDRFVGSGSAQG